MEITVIPDLSKELKDFSSEVEKWLNLEDVKSLGDIAILLGGDGFIMRTSLDLAKNKTPFLAINCGTTGFLAAAEKDNWQDVLKLVIRGKYSIDKRPVLDVGHFNRLDGEIGHYEAAGNVYIRHRTDMVLADVSVDGKVVYDKLRGDGVIVANATGATAYNLAAGGALISSGFVITPICPHAINVRSLPVPDSKKIVIIYRGRKSSYGGEDEGCVLCIDSTRYQISSGDRLEIKRSEKEECFIIPDGFSFIESLQKKLGLSK